MEARRQRSDHFCSTRMPTQHHCSHRQEFPDQEKASQDSHIRRYMVGVLVSRPSATSPSDQQIIPALISVSTMAHALRMREVCHIIPKHTLLILKLVGALNYIGAD
jgi:hypothetical protein